MKLLKFRNNGIDCKYVYYYLRSIRLPDTGYNRHYKWLKLVNIPIPRLDVQRKIADVLDRAAALIEKRKAQIEKLNLLVKSRFVEMFGDPITNPMKWEISPLGNHAGVLTGNPFDSNKYTNKGIKICGGLIIMPEGILWNEAKRWDSSCGLERFLLKTSDIVLAMDRPWISSGFKIAQIKENDLPALLIQRTARIRGDDVNQTFLFWMLNSHKFRMHCKVTETTVPHISIGDIRNYKIFLPPLDLQNQFSDFVNQIDKSRLAFHQSLKKIEFNYNSLMQKCFRGEIF